MPKVSQKGRFKYTYEMYLYMVCNDAQNGSKKE